MTSGENERMLDESSKFRPNDQLNDKRLLKVKSEVELSAS
jgi:hypothetical protein